MHFWDLSMLIPGLRRRPSMETRSKDWWKDAAAMVGCGVFH
jgi:hypothetical protein